MILYCNREPPPFSSHVFLVFSTSRVDGLQGGGESLDKVSHPKNSYGGGTDPDGPRSWSAGRGLYRYINEKVLGKLSGGDGRGRGGGPKREFRTVLFV